MLNKKLKVTALSLVTLFVTAMSSLNISGIACNYLLGDVNHDGLVNLEDASILALSWMAVTGDAEFNPDCDFNKDGIVDTADAAVIGLYWSRFLKVHVFIMPQVLNLKSRGNWITCIILLPYCVNASDVDLSSIRLNNTITASKAHICDCFNALAVKFSRSTVIELIRESLDSKASICCRKFYPMTLTVTGNLSDGLGFCDSDVILAIHHK